MLQSVQSQHFQALLGRIGTLHLPDGSTLQVHIGQLEENPSAKMRYSERMPFSVELNSVEPTEFVDGLCALELPELGRVQGIFVSRVPPMGRDPQLAYFHITFN
ncbi:MULTISPECIES: hypothetical protein [Pseudomonas]|jgi:hypothetical protein|uniref:DUF6916 domain-containing protein n=1 Tax=Pseudomonas monsensis TaxID=2745509 RepID=A0ABT3Z048_9PSED|nr:MULTISPECIES: hypothetical protein [Pseudomonas]PTT63706.1 hypothetical protein DBR26_22165 [Pseudomonas sp. HMWF007]RON59255.1 hypothetical protein BK669_25120 [Pseudomonas fluorescens]MCY0111070.1 hypothetical protein [Pseudomonas monsensis]MDZ3828045.1 hypothetical protein [Pseudomonas monsensis]PTT03665.1 hypothetical protein DBR24_04635 [Pseudomonas sp. HMWF006]